MIWSSMLSSKELTSRCLRLSSSYPIGLSMDHPASVRLSAPSIVKNKHNKHENEDAREHKFPLASSFSCSYFYYSLGVLTGAGFTVGPIQTVWIFTNS